MSMIHYRASRLFFIVVALGLCQIASHAGGAAASELITLRSGNNTVGSADPFINMKVGAGGAPLSPNPFTSTDFDEACIGPDAIVMFPHPAWVQHLPCDSLAQWIGIDMNGTPASALYCYGFAIETCCIERATLNFCWAADDCIGDSIFGGANPAGVYLNGIPVSPMITGGNYGSETQSGSIDVTSLVQCGNNELAVYNRDAGFAISGVIFSAEIEILECVIPTEESNWGSIKSLY
jgi:hypothetical protein